MCVCDLGGVYIKPTRPWVVVPTPSSLATVTLSRRLAVSLCHLVTWSHVHLFTWLPGHLFASGHLVAWSSSHLVAWSSVHLVDWLTGCPFASSRLHLLHLLFALPCFHYSLAPNSSLLCISASFSSRINPYSSCPDFTGTIRFMSR